MGDICAEIETAGASAVHPARVLLALLPGWEIALQAVQDYLAVHAAASS